MKKPAPLEQNSTMDRLRETFGAAREPIPEGVKPDAIVRLLEKEGGPAPVHKRRWLRAAVPLAACAAAVAIAAPFLLHPPRGGVGFSSAPEADTYPQMTPEEETDRLCGTHAAENAVPSDPATAVKEEPADATAGQTPSSEETSFTLLSADSLQSLLSKGAVLLDLRDASTYAAGHIAQAENLPLDQLKARIGALAPEEETVILYGDTEESCREASRQLSDLGYREIISLGNFTVSWTYPTETLPPLTAETSD